MVAMTYQARRGVYLLYSVHECCGATSLCALVGALKVVFNAAFPGRTTRLFDKGRYARIMSVVLSTLTPAPPMVLSCTTIAVKWTWYLASGSDISDIHNLDLDVVARPSNIVCLCYCRVHFNTLWLSL